MKCVFHIITHFDLGGAEKVAVSIASSPNPEFEYHIVEVVRGMSSYSDEFIKDMKNRGIKYHRSLVGFNKLGIILFPLWFVFLFLRYRPTVIHSHTEIPELSVYCFYRTFGWMFRKTKYIRTIHNIILWDEWLKIGDMVERFFIRQHSNIAISKAVQNNYYNFYGEWPRVIYNGVKEVEQQPFEGIDKTKTNILFAGRLEYQKGIDELIEVITKCQDKKNLVFWIIGNGSLYWKIKRLKDNNQNVHYYEKVYNLSSFLSSFDYLFMPSNFEGLGLISIEASFAKVPAIINSCNSLNETLPDNWPLKVDNNNLEQYLELFSKIDGFDRISLGDEAYKYVKEKFSMEVMQSAYENIYQD